MESNDMEFWSLTPAVIGKKIKSVTGLDYWGDRVEFTFEDDCVLSMYHRQDCCENVSLEDWGDTKPEELIGGVVALFEKCTKDGDPEHYGVQQYTFYHMRTTKGDITMRWCGESNGYYSVEVTTELEDKDGNTIDDDF
mgnify:CR=1 FL=1